MTTADRWTRVVRERVGLGRLLPLGGPVDGAWIAERAARHVLLAAAGEVPGVRPGGLRVGLVDPDAGREPAVPPPPGALPPGELRVTADFAAFVGGAATAPEPLPAMAARLRAALTRAATARLGLAVVDVDLRVTDLLGFDAATGTAVGREPDAGPGQGPADALDEDGTAGAGDADGDGGVDGGVDGGGDEGRVAAAALAVPGVARLTGVLGRSVHLTRSPREGALPRRHVRVELALEEGRRADEVARRVRAVVSEALPDRPSVAVVVTAVG
ncbi:nucleopolyhedrovirus P10 family protein [Streptomyces sp. NPDC048187]|uniref:nucleopolyhedrovirus P10 family protein n=1 Tax=Streptomyces sp. NPDC048187 TaxID=3365509 RepID=UPI0037215E5A